MKNIIVMIIAAASLQGCAIFGWNSVDPITINKKAVERTPLNLPDPAPLKPSVVEWIVITPENQERVFADLKAKNMDLVVFALTDDGYEELAINMAQIRNYIAHQREIIIKYREYYEPKKTEEQKK